MQSVLQINEVLYALCMYLYNYFAEIPIKEKLYMIIKLADFSLNRRFYLKEKMDVLSAHLIKYIMHHTTSPANLVNYCPF
jgi:hypothetical protein